MEAAAWIGLALLVLALALGYVLDARAHGGARLRGDDDVGAILRRRRRALARIFRPAAGDHRDATLWAAGA